MRLQEQVKAELRKELRAERYDMSAEGVYFPRNGIMVAGEYWGRVNHGKWEHEGDNLVVTEGLVHILNVALGSTAKAGNFYLALFSGASAPDANWTGTTFASAASEIVSQAEGYTNATRPLWQYTNASGSAQIDNFSNPAVLTIATAASLNVTGAALLSSSTRGGTTGVLVSASKFAATRTFQDGDTYELGYRLNATV